MIKSIIYVSLLLTSFTFAQETEYVLSSAIGVGCSTGMTDAGKKITVEKQTSGVKYNHVNMVCSKTYDAGLTIDAGNGATAYYADKDKKGIVIDGNVISLFEQKDGKYNVYAVGHTDKKEAKGLDLGTYQSKYTATFGAFEKEIEKAKVAEKQAKIAANMLPVPSGNYTDRYGISGLYYFSEPSEVFLREYKEHIYANSVQLELLEGEGVEPILKAYYKDDKYDQFRISYNDLWSDMHKGKEVKIYDLDGDNMNLIQVFKSTTIQMLEEGIWIVHYYGSMTGKLDCSEAQYTPKKDNSGNEIKKFFIMGKDKARVEELSKNYENTLALASAKRVERCEYYSALNAAKSPMPAPGMKNAALLSEVTEAVKLGTARWSQKIEYCYIKGKDWVILKNKNTGMITSRVLSVIVVMKTPAGKCQWEEVSVIQNYDGAGYGKTLYRGNTQVIVPVDCSTAMKYK